MNALSRQFFAVGEGGLQEVIFLQECPDLSWEQIEARALNLPRGWFELSRLSSEDRIEFVRDFWLHRLSFQPNSHESFLSFFDQLDEIGIVLIRRHNEEALSAEMVYSLRENRSFFRGLPPATEEEIRTFSNDNGYLLPRDYLSFLRIHNGFGQLSDIGLAPFQHLEQMRYRLLDLLLGQDVYLVSGERGVDVGSLLPFYESIGSYQCFYADWHPGNEMGNVYLSTVDYTLSDIEDAKLWAERGAFPTFLEWLSRFLEGMSVE